MEVMKIFCKSRNMYKNPTPTSYTSQNWKLTLKSAEEKRINLRKRNLGCDN